MPEFSIKSNSILDQAHPNLQRLFRKVVKHFDCSIICSHRGRVSQESAFENGKSKAHFGQSPHNFPPSLAVDVVPYPIDWQDVKRMVYFAGFVMATAQGMGIKITWGGDWDGDTNLSDNHFNDFPHFELTGWREMVKETT